MTWLLNIAFAVLILFSPEGLFAAHPTAHGKCTLMASKQGLAGPMKSFMKVQDDSFQWSDAEYAEYLGWLRANYPRSNSYGSTHNLNRVLADNQLALQDLERIMGRVLLAGEGPTDQEGLYSALKSIRRGTHHPDSEVIALDLGYRGRAGDTVEGTVTRMPFKDSSFRMVISYMVAHYLRSGNQQAEFIAEVIRVLQPGGEARLGPFLESELKILLELFGNRVHMETAPGRQNTHLLIIRK